MAKKNIPSKNNSKWLWIGVIIIVCITGWIIINLNSSPKLYCGDGMCNADENKCSCSSDCGNCYDVQGCNHYTCNYNQQCVIDYTEDYCCGNNKCETSENCNSCSKDCGGCVEISSDWEAINQIERREDITQKWENLVKQRNCEIRYLDISSAVIQISRVTLSQNLISCKQRNSFYDFLALAEKGSLSYSEEIFRLNNCDKGLVEEFNKAIRGYDGSLGGLAKVEETCEDCDDFYAIFLGCVDVRVDVYAENEGQTYSSGVGIYSPSEATAFVIVDKDTGVVYW